MNFSRIKAGSVRSRFSNIRNEDGAIDISSVIVAAVLAGIIALGVTANVLGLLPWGHDMAAKQDLTSVKTAQAVHKAQTSDGLSYGASLEALKTADLIGQDAKPEALAVAGDTDEWAAVNLSGSGSYFSISSKDGSPRKMTGTYANPAAALAGVWDEANAGKTTPAVKAEAAS